MPASYAEKAMRPRPLATPSESPKPPLELVSNLTETQKYLVGIQETASEIIFARYGYDVNKRGPEKIHFQKYIAEKIKHHEHEQGYPRLNQWVTEWMTAEHADIPSQKMAMTVEECKQVCKTYSPTRVGRAIIQIMEERRSRPRAILPDELIDRTATLTSALDALTHEVGIKQPATQLTEYTRIVHQALLPVIEYGVISTAEIQTILQKPLAATAHA